MQISIDIPVAELFDKITILEIKAKKIVETTKRLNVVNELAALRSIRNTLVISEMQKLNALVDELSDANQKLWDIEDRLRRHEEQKNFGKEFIELARSVYITNDKRASIKRAINLLLGSDLIEEKEYEPY